MINERMVELAGIELNEAKSPDGWDIAGKIFKRYPEYKKFKAEYRKAIENKKVETYKRHRDDYPEDYTGVVKKIDFEWLESDKELGLPWEGEGDFNEDLVGLLDNLRFDVKLDSGRMIDVPVEHIIKVIK